MTAKVPVGLAKFVRAEPIELTGMPQDLADACAIRIGVKYDQPGIGRRPDHSTW